MHVVEEIDIYVKFEEIEEMREIINELSEVVSGIEEDCPFVCDLLSALNEYENNKS